MSTGHFHDAGGYIEYDEMALTLPVDELKATVHTHRDAERVLTAAAPESVLAVRPTGLATSYALTQRPLAAIEVATLDDEPRRQLETAAGIDIQQFELLQVGKGPSQTPNRTLAEF